MSGMILSKSYIHVYSRGSSSPRHLVPLSRWGNWSWYGCRGVISYTVQKVHLSQGNHHAGFWTSDRSPGTGQSGSQILDLLRYLQHSMSCTHTCYRVRGGEVCRDAAIPVGVGGIFHWHNPSGRTMVLGSTQPLTEKSSRNFIYMDPCIVNRI